MSEFERDDALVQFAEERSHRDSQASNENVRAAAQASILINGGAATAILAYLSKDKLDPSVLQEVSWCLVGYSLGVLAAAAMMMGMMRYTDWYHFYWRLTAHPEPGRDPNKIRKKAGLWLKITIGCFIFSMFWFVASTFGAAWSLYRSHPPQQIVSQPEQSTRK